MTAISAKLVSELRTKTGAGMMDCKKALAESAGDLGQAEDYLRKKGLSAASKKAGRIASEGVVGSYIHGGGKIGVLIEVNCETDFVARNEDFKNFVRDVAMHVAAANPIYVTREEVPEAEVAKEKEILTEQARMSGKPEAVIEKMVEGRIGKFFAEVCLMEQPFVREPEKTVDQMVNELTAKIGEKISIRRFTRFQMGEGLAKKSEDFAAEVASVMAN